MGCAQSAAAKRRALQGARKDPSSPAEDPAACSPSLSLHPNLDDEVSPASRERALFYENYELLRDFALHSRPEVEELERVAAHWQRVFETSLPEEDALGSLFLGNQAGGSSGETRELLTVGVDDVELLAAGDGNSTPGKRRASTALGVAWQRAYLSLVAAASNAGGEGANSASGSSQEQQLLALARSLAALKRVQTGVQLQVVEAVLSASPGEAVLQLHEEWRAERIHSSSEWKRAKGEARRAAYTGEFALAIEHFGARYRVRLQSTRSGVLAGSSSLAGKSGEEVRRRVYLAFSTPASTAVDGSVSLEVRDTVGFPLHPAGEVAAGTNSTNRLEEHTFVVGAPATGGGTINISNTTCSSYLGVPFVHQVACRSPSCPSTRPQATSEEDKFLDRLTDSFNNPDPCVVVVVELALPQVAKLVVQGGARPETEPEAHLPGNRVAQSCQKQEQDKVQNLLGATVEKVCRGMQDEVKCRRQYPTSRRLHQLMRRHNLPQRMVALLALDSLDASIAVPEVWKSVIAADLVARSVKQLVRGRPRDYEHFLGLLGDLFFPPPPSQQLHQHARLLHFALLLRVATCLVSCGEASGHVGAGENESQPFLENVARVATGTVFRKILPRVKRNPLALARAISHHLGAQLGTLEVLGSRFSVSGEVDAPDEGEKKKSQLLPPNKLLQKLFPQLPGSSCGNFLRVFAPLDDATEACVLRSVATLVAAQDEAKGKAVSIGGRTTNASKRTPSGADAEVLYPDDHFHPPDTALIASHHDKPDFSTGLDRTALVKFYSRLLAEHVRARAGGGGSNTAFTTSSDDGSTSHFRLKTSNFLIATLTSGTGVEDRARGILRCVLNSLVRHEQEAMVRRARFDAASQAWEVLPPPAALATHHDPSKLLGSQGLTDHAPHQDQEPMVSGRSPKSPARSPGGRYGYGATSSAASNSSISMNSYVRLGEELQEVLKLLSELAVTRPELLVAHWALRGYLYERRNEMDIAFVDYLQAYQVLEDMYGEAAAGGGHPFGLFLCWKLQQIAFCKGEVKAIDKFCDIFRALRERWGQAAGFACGPAPSAETPLSFCREDGGMKASDTPERTGPDVEKGYQPKELFRFYAGSAAAAATTSGASSATASGAPFRPQSAVPAGGPMDSAMTARFLRYAESQHFYVAEVREEERSDEGYGGEDEGGGGIPTGMDSVADDWGQDGNEEQSRALTNGSSPNIPYHMLDEKRLLSSDACPPTLVAQQMSRPNSGRGGGSDSNDQNQMIPPAQPHEPDHAQTRPPSSSQINRFLLICPRSRALEFFRDQMQDFFLRADPGLLQFTKEVPVEFRNRFGTLGPADLDQEVSKGSVFCVGSNIGGQLGVGEPGSKDVDWSSRPLRLMSLLGERIVEIASGVGSCHNVARSSDGRLYQWGHYGVAPVRRGESSYDAEQKVVVQPSSPGNVFSPRSATDSPRIWELIAPPGRRERISAHQGRKSSDDLQLAAGSGKEPPRGGEAALQVEVIHYATPQRLPWDSKLGVRQLATGAHFTVLLSEEGSVSVCGFYDADAHWAGADGVLGVGHVKSPRSSATSTSTQHLHRVAIKEGGESVRIKQVASGSFHVCALSEAGALYSWGRGDGGQLGIEQGKLDELFAETGDTYVAVPQRIVAEAGEVPPLVVPAPVATEDQVPESSKADVVVVKAGGGGGVGEPGEQTGNTSTASKQSTKSQTASSLDGDPRAASQTGENKGAAPPPPPVRFAQVACGEVHCCAVDEQGSVFAWGWGEFGQLGCGETGRSAQSWTPRRVTGGPACATSSTSDGGPFGGKRVRQVACGGAFSVALTVREGGSANVPGGATATASATGRGTTTSKSPQTVVEVESPSGSELPLPTNKEQHVQASEMNLQRSTVFNSLYPLGGHVYAWGSNERGQVHQDVRGFPEVSSPHFLPNLAHVCIAQIACGLHHTLAVDTGGKVWSWGANSHGQLGTRSLPKLREPAPGAAVFSGVPQLLQSLNRVKVRQVACGREHSLLLS